MKNPNNAEAIRFLETAASTSAMIENRKRQLQPGEQSAEIVARRGTNRAGRVAGGLGEMVSAHAMVEFERADARLDRGAGPF